MGMAGFGAFYRIRISRPIGRGRHRSWWRSDRLWKADARAHPGVHDARKINNRDTRPGSMVGIRAAVFLCVGASANKGAVLAHDGLARIAFGWSIDIRIDPPLHGRRRDAWRDWT